MDTSTAEFESTGSFGVYEIVKGDSAVIIVK
jgi:hypothetical protein